ncbi:MAG: hypothetical protein M3503_02305 [Actinomycetota bacterium]|nr:hypothetical protein [Actinomycetota bacterium]
MPRIFMFVAPTVGRWLWKKYKANAAQKQGLPRAATIPATSRPQDQIEAMEDAVDVPGGIRP